MKKAAIVFDWDDVIFDTAGFKKHIAGVLASEGIDRKMVLSAFDVAKDAHGYNPAIHANMIAKYAGANAPRISRLIWADCRHFADKLLFPDAGRTLRAIHKRGVPLYVLSAGRRRFQKARIYGSDLTHLFKDIHIVDVTSPDAAVATKAKVLARLAKEHENLVFLDDRPKTVAGIDEIFKSAQGKVLSILVWRKKEKPPQTGAPVIHRLSWTEIRKIAIHNGFGPY